MASAPGKKDSCIVVLLVGGSLLTGLSCLLAGAAGWLL
jgi:hypothetical protein